MISVYITIPNLDGWVHKHCWFALRQLIADRRYKIRDDAPTHTPYVHNLHKCMWDFLINKDDFWLSFDADNPPTRNPLDMIEHNLDVVGFPTPVWCNTVPGDRPYYFNAMDRTKDGYTPHKPCEGLQEVDAIGSGCFLVSRRVMYDLRFNKPFMRQWGDEGLVEKGCDFSFCDKVKLEGYKIWANYDYPCRHFNEIELTEVIQAFNSLPGDTIDASN